MSNMFKKANESRGIADTDNKEINVDEILGDNIPKSNLFKQISNPKKRRNLTLDKDLDDLYRDICEITNTTVSEVMQQVLIDALYNNKDIIELSNYNEEVRNLINNYKRK